VPLSLIHDVTGDSVFLSINSYDDELARFKARPEYLNILH